MIMEAAREVTRPQYVAVALPWLISCVFLFSLAVAFIINFLNAQKEYKEIENTLNEVKEDFQKERREFIDNYKKVVDKLKENDLSIPPKVSNLTEKPQWKNQINIAFRTEANLTPLSLTSTEYTSSISPFKHFFDFYFWYISKKDSPIYVWRLSGETIVTIDRKNISQVNLSKIFEEKETPKVPDNSPLWRPCGQCLKGS